MGSGGGGGDGGGMMALMGQGTPMPGLPIAGQGGGVNPREYGMFQNFLPEPVEEGQNPMATGLRPDMLKFRSPTGVMAEGSGGGGGGDVAGQIQGLRNELAKLTAGGGGGGAVSGDPFTQEGIAMQNMTRGGIGTMGMGMGGRAEPPTYGYNGGGRMPPFWGTGVRYAAQPPAGQTIMPNNPMPTSTTGDPVVAAQLQAQQRAAVDKTLAAAGSDRQG